MPASAAAAPACENAQPPLPPSTREKSFLQMLWPLLRPHKWLVAGAVACTLISGFAATFQNITPKYLIDGVVLAEVPFDQKLMRLVGLIAAYLFASIVARMLIWHLGFRLFTDAREKAIYELRLQFFKHVNHLCLRFHQQRSSGELFSYLFGSPLNNLQQYLRNATMMAPMQIIMIASTCGMMAFWDIYLGLALLGLLLGTVWTMRIAKKKVQALHRDYQDTEADVSGRVADLLRGNRAVKLHAMEHQVALDFDEDADVIRQKSYERDVKSHVEVMRQESLRYAFFAVLCGIGAWRYWSGAIEVGELSNYLAAFFMLQGPMSSIFQLVTQHGAAEASLQRIDAVLATASTTPDPVGDVADPPGPGEIELDAVTFGYLPGQVVLREVALRVPYGQHVALVGPSGGGKSTLTQLLLRLYDPDEGAVRIAGVDLRRCNGPDVRTRFAIVPQDPFVFRTTIRENLRIAKGDATEPELIAALKRAHAWDFVQEMEHGLDEPVGEGGSSLSGGQRQRLAIARALLYDAPYYIFDEATSALDTVSEQRVQEATYDAVRGRTAFIIAHRLATVKHCDRVLVIDRGRIVQDGSYADLAEQEGLFRDLLDGQRLLA